ncbi:MAG: MBL fold metallo-hydrolase [Lachnospiraceae bacterium]|nr:MBL fold metallo-hydrolase [Lachnospiraceae bacterium]
MYIRHIVVGEIQTNCYIAGDDAAGSCIVVDPGDEADKIIGTARRDGREIAAILLTHGHFDHIGAVGVIRDKCGAKVYACAHEKELLASPSLNLSSGFPRSMSENADIYVQDGDMVNEAGLSLRVIETPGHTSGGVCYYSETDKVLFSGDTLFEASIGRTDFPTGSAGILITSIREKLYVLPDDVSVYPGHGPYTSIGFEKMNNMYVQV